ncbi:hypothetical protein Tco_1003202 [Tanacetum coccineum]|uniref:Uncharacterized protein n=1 Tax=Tanacetum coccineum TaxID=301880 RepID=A0ABQ5F8Z9_9ASTR
MNNSKCGHIPVQERLDLNKTQGASTPKEVKRMQNVPYALAVGSIMYADTFHFERKRSRLEKLQVKYYCKPAIAASEAEMKAVWIRKFISGLGIGFAAVLAILVTGASQSRQHVGTSLIHIESCKSPTAELFEVDSGRVFIRYCEILTEYEVQTDMSVRGTIAVRGGRTCQYEGNSLLSIQSPKGLEDKTTFDSRG